MTRLGTISVGSSDLDPRFKQLLEDSGLEREEFEDLDWFGLLPFFVLAGASVETHVQSHGDHFHFQGVELSVPDELTDAFLDVLPQILDQLSDEDQADGAEA
jgi:hypothetical protein